MNYFICGRLREKEIESVLTHLVSFLYIILCIFAVAPHAGAWIEIEKNPPLAPKGYRVAPHAGAWIEILSVVHETVYGSVSHPTRVRGLKLKNIPPKTISLKSHPTRVRGLKSKFGKLIA